MGANVQMPYITCAHCRVTSYVALSYLTRGERCPACGGSLDERARVIFPALLVAAHDGNEAGRPALERQLPPRRSDHRDAHATSDARVPTRLITQPSGLPHSSHRAAHQR